MSSTLRTLLDRVEKGEGADREIDVQLAYLADYTTEDFSLREIVDRDGLQSMVKRVETSFNSVWRLLPAYTSSIDAAVALVEKVLPGFRCGFNSQPDKLVQAWVADDTPQDWPDFSALAKSPARAILAATLRAKIAQEGEEAYWSAPKDEDRCTAMAAAYRAMRAAAKADAPDPHVLQDRLHGMLRMAVASEDSFNRLSPAGRRLIQAAEGFFASSREDRDDLNACWDALQAETKRADAAEARLAALLRAKIAQEEKL